MSSNATAQPFARRDAPMPSFGPALSVIVPSVNGLQDLTGCLSALQIAGIDVPLEILVVDRCGEGVRREIRERFPQMKVLAAAEDTTIPQLRAIGFRHASGDNVAVIEDHVVVPGTWARQLLSALGEGHDVVAGSVYNAATASTVDWAAFLCEYSHLLAPTASGTAASIAGNNVAYRRQVLERYATVVDAGRWEDYLHAAMRRDGVGLLCRPDISVAHKKHYFAREYLSQRYLYARSYAGLRRADMAPVKQALLSVGSLALPPVLFARIVSRVLAARRYRSELVRSLPLIALFVCAWAAGEAIGYAAGPGDALSHVK